MVIEMGYLFNRKGSTLPVELVETIDDVKDYPDVVEFVEPVELRELLRMKTMFSFWMQRVKRQC